MSRPFRAPGGGATLTQGGAALALGAGQTRRQALQGRDIGPTPDTARACGLGNMSCPFRAVPPAPFPAICAGLLSGVQRYTMVELDYGVP